jgi:hypothetical protein
MTGTEETGSKRPSDERRFEALIRQQTETVPAEVGERLAAIRRQVVADTAATTNSPAEETSPCFSWTSSWPGLVLASTVAAVTLGVWLMASPGGDLLEIPLVSESEVVLVQDLALLEELEFAAWLEEDGLEEAGFEEAGSDEETPGAG